MIYKALLLFFIFEYVRPGAYVPAIDLLRLSALVPLVAVLGTLLGTPPVSSRRFWEDSNTKALGVLILLLLISVAWAPVTQRAYNVAERVFNYILIYMVLMRQLGDIERIKGVCRVLVAAHLIVIVLSPQLFSSGGERATSSSGSFLGDGNDFALSLCVYLPLCLFMLLDASRPLARVFWAVMVFIMVMSVVATQSRGGTLALIAVGLYFWIKSQRKVLTAAVAVCAVVIVFVAAPPEYFARMESMTDSEESSAQGRIDAWKAGFTMALGSPLVGVGAGHFGMAQARLAGGGRWVTAHSIYFLLLGELGFPGLFVLIFVIYYNLAANRTLQREVKRLDPERALRAANLLSCSSAALVGFAVAGAFLSAVYYPHLYMILGVLSATRYCVGQYLAAGVDPRAFSPRHDAMVPAPVPVRHGVISPEWRPALGARPASLLAAGDQFARGVAASKATGRRATRGDASTNSPQ